MKFIEFFEEQKKLMPGVRHDLDITCQAFIDNMRVWNAMAILFPEKCEDVLIWPAGEPVPHAEDNPYRTEEMKVPMGVIQGNDSNVKAKADKGAKAKSANKKGQQVDPEKAEGSESKSAPDAAVDGNTPGQGGENIPPEPGQ